MATIYSVLMVSIGGIHPPENLKAALRIDTGEVRTVRSVYWHTVDTPEEADDFVANLPEGHAKAGATKALVADEEITGYKLRLNQEVESPVVTGGWSLLPMSIGGVDFYRVTADAVHLEALHNWIVAEVNPYGGAIAVENNLQPHTMKTNPVRDLLFGGVGEWDARLAALAGFFDTHGSPDTSHILAATTDPELFGALLMCHPATPDALRDDVPELLRRFWGVW